MPRPDKLVRITPALVAAALFGALAVTSAGAASAKRTSSTLNGAGSTFVSPLVQAWVGPVKSKLGMTLNYSAAGSGAGIAAITGRTVDFGASDAPLAPDQFSACKGCIQIPWALASTSVFYNLPGVGNFLHMSGPVLAKIYLGKITKWNDPAIAKLNRGRSLPSTSITVVHRSDGSGTTYNFADYLSSVNKTWKNQVGKGTAVNWPAGVGAPHSSGVAAVVRQTEGAIGYAETAFPIHNHLTIFKMRNRSGNFVIPKLKGTLAAAQLDTHPAEDGSLSIVNPPKSKKYRNAYPISTYTYVIVAKSSKNAAALKQLIGWAITKGQKYGPKNFFQPIPAAVVAFDKKALKKIRS
jgi:phosphate transport system substrate-binding protein